MCIYCKVKINDTKSKRCLIVIYTSLNVNKLFAKIVTRSVDPNHI